MRKFLSVLIISLVILTGCQSKKVDTTKVVDSMINVQINLQKFNELDASEVDEEKIGVLVNTIKKQISSSEYKKYKESVESLSDIDASKLDKKSKQAFIDFNDGHKGLIEIYDVYLVKLSNAKNINEFTKISEESGLKMAIPNDKIMSAADVFPKLAESELEE